MVNSDLFTFNDSSYKMLVVVQYENAGLPEKGISKHYLAEDNQRALFSLANNKNKAIYVVGGRVSSTTTNSVVVFSLETHEFKNCAPLNEARSRSSSTIAGETLYVFGG